MRRFVTTIDEATGERCLAAWRKDGQRGHILSIVDGVAMFWPWDGSGMEQHKINDLYPFSPPDLEAD